MKKNLLKTLLISSVAIVSVLGLGFTVMNAESLNTELSNEVDPSDLETIASYSLEEMLVYAIQDEYLAQSQYQAIITTYGEVRPFTSIIKAEQTHIDLLMGLFTTYGYAIPENNASLNIVVPDSISAAISSGIDAENKNIAIYEAFLSRTDLPDDVRSAFEYLANASRNHLNAFSRDRLYGYGSDLSRQFKNAFKKGTGDGSKSGNQYKGANGNKGVCPNA